MPPFNISNSSSELGPDLDGRGAGAMDAPEREPPRRQRSTHRFEKGFTDWRTSVADKKERQRQNRGGGSDDGGGGGGPMAKKFAARRRERRRVQPGGRRYHQVHSSSLTELSPSTPLGKDADEAPSRHHSEPSMSRPKSNKRSGRGDDATLKDGSKRSGKPDAARNDGPSLTSLGTEETNKLSNTTKATIDKYKTLYEAMLRDIEKDESDTTWVGLGDVSKETAVVAKEICNSVADRKTGLLKTKGPNSFNGMIDGNGRRRGDQERKSHSFHGGASSFRGASDGDARRRGDQGRKSHSFHDKKGSVADQISSQIASQFFSRDDGSDVVVNPPRQAGSGPSGTRPREENKASTRRTPPSPHKHRRNDHHATKTNKMTTLHDIDAESDDDESSFAGTLWGSTGPTHFTDKPRRDDRRGAKAKREKSFRSIDADGSPSTMKPKDKIKSEIKASFQGQGQGEGREEPQRPKSSSFHGGRNNDYDVSKGWYQPKKSSSFHGLKSSFKSTGNGGDGLKSSFKSTSSDGLKSSFKSTGGDGLKSSFKSTGGDSLKSSFKSTGSDGLKSSFKSTGGDGLKSSLRSADRGKIDDSGTRKGDVDDKAEAVAEESSFASIDIDSDDGSTAEQTNYDKCKSVRSDLLLVDDTIDGLDVEEVQLKTPSMDTDDAVGGEVTLGDSHQTLKRSNRKAISLLSSEAAGAHDGAVTPVNSPRQKVRASLTNDDGTPKGSPIAIMPDEKDDTQRTPSVRFTPRLDEDIIRDSDIEDDKSTDEKAQKLAIVPMKGRKKRSDEGGEVSTEEMTQKLALVPMKGRKKRSDEGGDVMVANSSSRSIALNISLNNPNEMALVATKARRKHPESESDRHRNSGRMRKMPDRKDSERNYRHRPRSRRDRSPSPSDGGRRGGRDRDRSRSHSPDSSVDSRRSNKSNRSGRRSGSRLRLPSPFSISLRSFKGDDSEDPTRPSRTSDDKDAKPKKGFFRKMKTLAGKVKNTLGDLGGIGGVHKYQLGEWARYRVVRPPRCLRSFDPVTMTVEVQILSVRTDAVLEIPYYTIRLPDGTSKQTSWDNLMSLSQYKKILAAARARADDPGYAFDDKDEDEESSSRWFRPLSRSRGSSRHKGRERSNSRHDSRSRPSSQRDKDDHEDERSRTSHKSSRSSAMSSSSRRSSSRGGRPRSPSPSPERVVRDRPRSSGKRQSSRVKPRERSPSPDARPQRASRDAHALSGRPRRSGGSGRGSQSSSANSLFSGEDGRPRRRGRDRPRSSSTRAARSGDGATGERRSGPGDRWRHHRSPTRVLDELESSTRSSSHAGVVQEEDF